LTTLASYHLQFVGPNKDELLSIIKYGADEIFESKGSTITDEDIDLILSRGQEKTSILNDKFKAKANNLLNFSLDSSASGNAIMTMNLLRSFSYYPIHFQNRQLV